MLYNILKDQWQTIEIDRIRSITQETEFSQMSELLYARQQQKNKRSYRKDRRIRTGQCTLLIICWTRSGFFGLFSLDTCPTIYSCPES